MPHEPQGLENLSLIAPGFAEAHSKAPSANSGTGALLSAGRLLSRGSSSVGGSLGSWKDDAGDRMEAKGTIKQAAPSMTVERLEDLNTKKGSFNKKKDSVNRYSNITFSDTPDDMQIQFSDQVAETVPEEEPEPAQRPWGGRRWVAPSSRNPRTAPIQRWYSYTKVPPESVGMKVHGRQRYGEAYRYYDIGSEVRTVNTSTHRDLAGVTGSTDKWMSRAFMGSLDLHQRMASGTDMMQHLSGLPTNLREISLPRKPDGVPVHLRKLNMDMVTVSPILGPPSTGSFAAEGEDETNLSIRKPGSPGSFQFQEAEPVRTGWSAEGNPKARSASRSPRTSPRSSKPNSPKESSRPLRAPSKPKSVPQLKIYDGLMLSKQQAPARRVPMTARTIRPTMGDSGSMRRPLTVRTKPPSQGRGWSLEYDAKARDPKLRKAVQLGEMLLALHTATSPKEVAISVSRIIGSMIEKSDTLVLKRTSMDTLTRYVGDTVDSWETKVELGKGIVGSSLCSQKPYYREFYANENSLDHADQKLGIRALGAVHAASLIPPSTEIGDQNIPFGVLVVQKTFGIFSAEEKEIMKVIRDHTTQAMLAQGETTLDKSFVSGSGELSPLSARSKVAFQKKHGHLPEQPTTADNTFLTQQPPSERLWGR